MISPTTILTPTKNFKVENIKYGEPVEAHIALGSGKELTFYRIPISIKNPDGTIGDLIISTPECFSFGVQENINKDNANKIDGYSMPLCMWNRDGPTPEQEDFLTNFTKIIDHIRAYVLANRESVEKYDLEEADLKKFNPLYWKRDKGVIVPGRGPTLYPKLITSRKVDPGMPPKIITSFTDDATNVEYKGAAIVNKYCHVTAAIKIESIFIGNKVSPQVKLYEAVVRLANTKSKRLLRPERDTKVRLLASTEIDKALGGSAKEEEDSDDDEGSDGSLSSQEEEVKPKVVVTKVIRRRKKKATP